MSINSLNAVPWVDGTTSVSQPWTTIWPYQGGSTTYHYCSCKTEYIKVRLKPEEFDKLRELAAKDTYVAEILNRIAVALEIETKF